MSNSKLFPVAGGLLGCATALVGCSLILNNPTLIVTDTMVSRQKEPGTIYTQGYSTEIQPSIFQNTKGISNRNTGFLLITFGLLGTSLSILDLNQREDLSEEHYLLIEKEPVEVLVEKKEEAIAEELETPVVTPAVNTPSPSAAIATPVTTKSPVANIPRKPLVSKSRTLEAEISKGEYDWIDFPLNYFAVLIWGQQGSGKSTFLRWFAEQREKMGHRILVVDTHYKYGDWSNADTVYGAAMNYAEVEDFLRFYDDLIKERAEEFANNPNPVFDPVTIFLEEQSGWSGNVSKTLLDSFGQSKLSDIRKFGVYLVEIAHGVTNTQINAKGGTHDTHERTFVYIHLLAKPNTDPVERIKNPLVPAFEAEYRQLGSPAKKVKMNPEWKPTDFAIAQPTKPETLLVHDAQNEVVGSTPVCEEELLALYGASHV